MHIAAAFGKPVVSLWGNTVPEFGMYPYYPGMSTSTRKQTLQQQPSDWRSPATQFEVRNLSCRPCSKIGYDYCPLGHFKCMEMIDPSAVMEKVEEIIRK
jgi:ADP-heptose:LPS heptosyltransferase